MEGIIKMFDKRIRKRKGKERNNVRFVDNAHAWGFTFYGQGITLSIIIDCVMTCRAPRNRLVII